MKPSIWTISDTNRSLSERFEEQAQLHPGKIAISGTSWQPSYAVLNAKSNRQANALMAKAFEPGRCIALLMEHDAPLISAALGVLKAGMTVLVLNPMDPAPHLERIRVDAMPVGVMVNQGHRQLALQAGFTPEQVWVWEQGSEGFADTNPSARASPDAAAFLVYTSGSSGKPKGVILTHRHILQTVMHFTNPLGFGGEERFLLLGSLGWGQGVSTTFSALLNGATLCPFPVAKKGLMNLARWIEDQEITILIAATSVFRQFIATLPSNQILQKIRVVRIGAEAAFHTDYEAYRQHFADTCIFATAYSCSEVGNITLSVLHKDSLVNEGELPVGKPSECIEVALLDEQNGEVPQGQIGQIVVRTPFPMGAYWRNEELSKKHFSCDSSRPDSWLFYTGDLGRLRPDGQLEHLGRQDAQIKVLGVRIEPAEIEALLNLQPGVQQSIICQTIDSDKRVQLIACIIPEPSATLNSRALRSALEEKLPHRMVPAIFHLLDAFPLTPNGKIDRPRLSAEMGIRPQSSGVGPRTDLEADIAEIWSRVLPNQSLGVYDDFFAAGGDSLTATELLLALSKKLERTLPLRLLLERRTIAQMAEAVESGLIGSTGKSGSRPWQASLLAMRSAGTEAPLVFIPGGYTSENELLAIAGLLPYLSAEFPVYGVRLNLLGKNVLEPPSLNSIATNIVESMLGQGALVSATIVGECQACALATEVAQVLAQKLDAPPRLVLLDPWQPRQATTDPNASHQRAIAAYYEYLRSYEPGPFSGDVHMICSEQAQRLQPCLEWWGDRLATACHGTTTIGDHHSYIRQHRQQLAESITSRLFRSQASHNPSNSTDQIYVPRDLR